ncbi:MAG TPA: copper resistance protein CopC, partial [Candidatus Limnocylindrales bacterium]
MTTPSRRRRTGASIGPALVLLLLVILFPTAVAAHAEFVESTPADGTTVEGTPPEIAAVFSEALEDASSLSLRDASGAEIAAGGRDDADRTRLVIVDVPDLAPGAYEVRWVASSDDGHLERDTWAFTVVAARTPTPTVAPTATPTPSSTLAPTAAPTSTGAPSPCASPDPGDGASTSMDVLLPIIAGLAIVAIAAGILLSRRGR